MEGVNGMGRHGFCLKAYEAVLDICVAEWTECDGECQKCPLEMAKNALLDGLGYEKESEKEQTP